MREENEGWLLWTSRLEDRARRSMGGPSSSMGIS